MALGLGTCYIFQIFLTIGGVTKFIPSTGVTLPLVSYGGTSVLSTIIMFAIIQGLYVLREDEEEDIERKKITEKTNFQIWISSWRACQTRADITTKRRRQKGKAAADERMVNQRKRSNAAA